MESIPIYSEITSQITVLQLTTAARDERVIRLLTQNQRGGGGLFGFGNRNRQDSSEEDEDRNPASGTGVRLRYSQLKQCIDEDSSPFIAR